MSLAKHLPPGYAVRNATAADAAQVAQLLRPVDLAEMEALEGRPALQILASMVDAPDSAPARVLTICKVPVMLYGIVACEGLPGNAMLWLASIESLAQDDLMNVMWMSRLQVDVWQHRWPRLQVVCGVHNIFRRQWLEWLGFAARGHLEAFGAARRPFDLYERGAER
jgi:hypothetical protein